MLYHRLLLQTLSALTASAVYLLPAAVQAMDRCSAGHWECVLPCELEFQACVAACGCIDPGSPGCSQLNYWTCLGNYADCAVGCQASSRYCGEVTFSEAGSGGDGPASDELVRR